MQRGGGRLCRLRVSLKAACQSSTRGPRFFLASNHNTQRSQERDIKGEDLGFYEAEFVKTRCENSFFLFLIHFWPPSGNNSPFRLWCLIAAVRGNERRKDQTPKSVTLSSAQRSWLKASNGINGRGPPEAGRMPVYAGCELEPMEWSATKAGGICFPAKVFLSDSLLLSFCFRLLCSSIFWLSTTFAVRTRAFSLGCSV